MSYCIYCGVPYGDQRDHVIPASFLSFRRNFASGEIVPSCGECNNTLGSKVITSVKERAAYLVGRYELKYRKMLQLPEWENWELEEMSESFQKTIKRNQIEKEIIQERLLNLRLQAGFISLD